MTSVIKSFLGLFAREEQIPFELEELESADERVSVLFQKSFHTPPPSNPRHFIVLHRENRRSIAAYVHYTVYESGVFLVGGLCVDPASYRLLTARERKSIATEGSLSRWLLKHSIERLGPKRAVFAFTGDTRSRRDTRVLGFVKAAEPYLIVQWHEQPVSTRPALIEKIVSLGPF